MNEVNTGPIGPNKEGFADVARWIALDPDGEASIYRKFGELRARLLLYKQSKLLALENRLKELDGEDVRSDDIDAKDAARTWEVLMRRYADGNANAKERVELIESIDVAMKEYSEALLLQSEIAKIRKPSKRALDALRQWFHTPHHVLGGLAKTFLDDAQDLVSLNTATETDYLSHLLRRHWPVTEELARDGHYRIGRFNEKSITITVAVISIIVAVFLLIGPIVGLYFVAFNSVKLVLIAFFTLCFALSVGLTTNAKRAEIFTATAAYAAVLVVFVSGNITSSDRQA